jgi:hypothetical protein
MPTTDTEQAINVAEQAAEALRALNHLTRRPGTLADPAETYLLLAALVTLAQRLPQLLNQINRRLNTDLDPTQLRVDDWAPTRDPIALLDHICSDLHCASHLADRLGTALDSAQQAIAHIAVTHTHQPTKDPKSPNRGSVFDRSQGVNFQPLLTRRVLCKSTLRRLRCPDSHSRCQRPLAHHRTDGSWTLPSGVGASPDQPTPCCESGPAGQTRSAGPVCPLSSARPKCADRSVNSFGHTEGDLDR